MQNEELRHLLPDYIAGTLDAPSRARIEARLEIDPDFNEEYLRLNSVFSLLEKDKNSARTPSDVSNLLVRVNAAIDTRTPSIFERLLRPKMLIPVAVVLQVVTIFVILSVYQNEDFTTQIRSEEIRAVLEDVEVAELALIEDYLNQDVVLPDLPVDVTSYTISSDVEDDFNEILEDEMFAELSFEDVLSASGSYLNEEELLSALPDQTFEKVLKHVNDSSLL